MKHERIMTREEFDEFFHNAVLAPLKGEMFHAMISGYLIRTFNIDTEPLDNLPIFVAELIQDDYNAASGVLEGKTVICYRYKRVIYVLERSPELWKSYFNSGEQKLQDTFEIFVVKLMAYILKNYQEYDQSLKASGG